MFTVHENLRAVISFFFMLFLVCVFLSPNFHLLMGYLWHLLNIPLTISPHQARKGSKDEASHTLPTTNSFKLGDKTNTLLAEDFVIVTVKQPQFLSIFRDRSSDVIFPDAEIFWDQLQTFFFSFLSYPIQPHHKLDDSCNSMLFLFLDL